MVIVPGNPLTPLFYIPLAHQLHALLEGRLAVRLLSFPRYSDEALALELATEGGSAAAHKAFHTLEDHIAFFAAYLEDVISRRRSQRQRAPRFFVAAHSIGAHITLHAMARRPDLGIAHAVLCMPFIRFDLSFVENLAYRAIFVVLPLMRLLLKLLRFVPRRVLFFLLRAFGGLSEPHALDTCVRTFMHPVIGPEGVLLGKDEFDTLPRAGADYEQHLVASPSSASAAVAERKSSPSSSAATAVVAAAKGSSASASASQQQQAKHASLGASPRGYLGALSPRLTFIYAKQHDTWAPMHQCEFLRKRLPAATFIVEPDCRVLPRCCSCPVGLPTQYVLCLFGSTTGLRTSRTLRSWRVTLRAP